MGLRDRIKRRVRESLIGPPAHARRDDTPVSDPEIAQSHAPQVGADTGSDATASSPPNKELPAEPPSPSPAPMEQPEQAEAVSESEEQPAPEATSEPSEPQVEESKVSSDSSVRIAPGKLLVSDYATEDAPVRNAHHAEIFETTEMAIPVRVTHTELGEELHFSCEPGEFVLDAAERAGLDLPYSCRSGGCLVCTARRTEGSSEMDEQYVLEEEHEDQGFTLLCCTTISEPSHFVSHQEGEVE